MEKQTYGKEWIIELVKEYGELDRKLDQTTLEKRLNEVLKFLSEKRVQERLHDHSGYFYTTEMGIAKAEGSKYKSYNYSLDAAVFLAVLVSLYENSFFKKIRNQSSIENPERETDEWELEFSERLDSFKPAWDKKENDIKKSWGIVSINLKSLLYQFTILVDVSKYVQEMQNELHTMVDLFDGLPDDHKAEIYNRHMERRVKYIKEKLEMYIKDLKDTNPDEYRRYEFNKGLVEIDKELNSY